MELRRFVSRVVLASILTILALTSTQPQSIQNEQMAYSGVLVFCMAFFVTSIPFKIHDHLKNKGRIRSDWSESIIEYLKQEIPKTFIVLIILYLKAPIVNYDNGIRCIRAPCPSGWVSMADSYLIGDATIYGIHHEMLPAFFLLCYYALTLLILVIGRVIERIRFRSEKATLKETKKIKK